MAPAAVMAPSLIGAGGGIIASLLGRKSVQGDIRQSPGERAATGAQTTAATGLANTGSQLTGQGMPQIQQAGRYFSTLANGNQAAQAQALAPDVENIQRVYGGTAKTLSRFLRGPERDTQMADLERERAGQIGSLFRNSRPQANANLAQFGGASVDAGMGATGQAANIFGSQANRGMEDRYRGADLSRQAGSDFGGLIFNMLRMYGKGGGGGGGGSTLGNNVGTVVPPGR